MIIIFPIFRASKSQQLSQQSKIRPKSTGAEAAGSVPLTLAPPGGSQREPIKSRLQEEHDRERRELLGQSEHEKKRNMGMRSTGKGKVVISSVPCRVGSVGSVSASRTVGREFASRPGHTKDHHKNGTNCLPA